MAWLYCEQTAHLEPAQRVALDQGGAFQGDGWVWCRPFGRLKMAAALAGAGFFVELDRPRPKQKTKLTKPYQRLLLARMFR